MSRKSFCRSPEDFFEVAKSRSLYSRVSSGGRPLERTLTATPPRSRTVSPASRAASRTRRPSSTMSARISEETNRAALFVDVDRVGGGSLAQSRHSLHVAAQGHKPARARVGTDVADGHGEAGRRVRQCRVVAEREMGLGHADRKPV